MGSWIVSVTDRQTVALAGTAGLHYVSPPHSDQEAQMLLRLLLSRPGAPSGPGPWTVAIAGGQRSISLHPADLNQRSNHA